MRIIQGVILLIIVLLGVSFSLLNASHVTVNLFAVSYHLPLSVLLLVVFGVGLLSGFLAFFVSFLRLKNECRRLRRASENKAQELQELRTIPYKELP